MSVHQVHILNFLRQSAIMHSAYFPHKLYEVLRKSPILPSKMYYCFKQALFKLLPCTRMGTGILSVNKIVKNSSICVVYILVKEMDSK